MHNAAAEGPVVTVSGHAHGTQAIVPITSNDLFAPAKQCHAYVAAGLNTLVGRVDTVNTAVCGGNLAVAKSAWPAGHPQPDHG